MNLPFAGLDLLSRCALNVLDLLLVLFDREAGIVGGVELISDLLPHLGSSSTTIGVLGVASDF
jgi:hypothetical protein